VVIVALPESLASEWNAGEDGVPKLPINSGHLAVSHVVDLISAFDPEYY
jgi:hypothetical protein